MQDRPTADELLAAVQTFLERDLVPTLVGRLRFHARVAANVLAIVRRELALSQGQLYAEWMRLARVLGKGCEAPPTNPEVLRNEVVTWTHELCEHIRAAPLAELLSNEALWEHLERTVHDKLAVTNPRWLSPLVPPAKPTS